MIINGQEPVLLRIDQGDFHVVIGTVAAQQLDQLRAQLADDARQMLDNEALRCGLIRTGNHTIGCSELKLDGSDGWIESVSLLPASRGKGNGGAAVVRLIEMLRQLGSATVKLSVIDANEKAYRLYQRLGFAVEQVLSRWYVKK